MLRTTAQTGRKAGSTHGQAQSKICQGHQTEIVRCGSVERKRRREGYELFFGRRVIKFCWMRASTRKTACPRRMKHLLRGACEKSIGTCAALRAGRLDSRGVVR